MTAGGDGLGLHCGEDSLIKESMRRVLLRLIPSLLVVLGLTASAQSFASERPVVAVFTLENDGAPIKTRALERLSDYIGAALTASGRYQVVPKSELKAALQTRKKASYKQCYAESCQIEIGKELAADKALAGTVARFGSRCIISLRIVDLKKATEEAAARAKGGCRQDDVLESLDKALALLTGAVQPTGAIQPAGAVQPAKTPKGGFFGSILGKPKTNVQTKGSALAVLPGTYNVPLGRAARRGRADALVTIVEFGDLQCPYCARAAKTLKQLEAAYGRDVRIVFKHNPLSFHPDALRAAEYTLAAGQQGKFWLMHDKLFENPKALKLKDLDRYALQVGLNLPMMKAYIGSGVPKARIQADQALAKRLGARGTPTFFINGQKLAGAQGLAQFKSLIDSQIAAARRLVASGVPRRDVYVRVTERGLNQAPKP